MSENKEKSEGTTTIEVSIETAKKLHSSKANLAKILRKKNISFDQLFRIFYEVKPINTILEDMIIEEGEEASWKKKKQKS